MFQGTLCGSSSPPPSAALTSESASVEPRLLLGEWSELQFDALAFLHGKGERADSDRESFQAESTSAAERAFKSYIANTATEGETSLSSPSSTVAFGKGMSHIKLAELCDKMLADWSASRKVGALQKGGAQQPLPFDQSVTASKLAGMVITHTLAAIKNGNSPTLSSGAPSAPRGSNNAMNTAMSSIPRLLGLVRKYPANAQIFIDGTALETNGVPTWPFLRWTSQMMALLDREVEGNAVVPLLERMAREFPQAMRFPFNITMESLLDDA